MDRYRTLLEVNNAVINCLGQAQLLEAVSEVLKRVIPCDQAGLALYDPVHGPASEGAQLAQLEGLRSRATAPLIVRGERIGVLGVGSVEPAKYDAEALELLEEVASQVALAAANVRAYELIRARTAHLAAENSHLHDEIRAKQASTGATDGSLMALERRHISEILERCRWVIEGNRGAAKVLGLHPNTLRHRLRKLELKRPSKVRS